MTWARLRLIGAVLLGMLVISTIIITTGRQSADTWPSINSTRPSGSAALAQLLESRGWEVEMNRQRKPSPGEGDLVVAFVLEVEPSFTAADEVEQRMAFIDHLREQAKAGATVVILPVSARYDADSKDVSAEQVTASFDPEFQAEVSTRSYPKPLATAIGATIREGYLAYHADNSPFIHAAKIEKGSMWLARDGIGATNRFLDQAENAILYTTLLERLSRGNQRVIFAEAGFGNAVDQSISSLLGTWSKAFQWQIALLMLVVIFTLGRRFGKPEIDPEKQRSTRDLLIAAGQAMKRGRHRQLAVDMIYSDAMERVRNAIGALQTETDADVIRRLPPDLGIAIKRVGGMSAKDASQREILAAVANMERHVDGFTRTYRGGRARP